MQTYKTEEFINSLYPEPGFMLIQLIPDENSYYTGGKIIMAEMPKQPFTATVVKTGGPEYMLSNGTYAKSKRTVGEKVIIDPSSYPAHLSYTVESNKDEEPKVYRLVPEYIVVCTIHT
jgi:hypothetical protein